MESRLIKLQFGIILIFNLLLISCAPPVHAMDGVNDEVPIAPASMSEAVTPELEEGQPAPHMPIEIEEATPPAVDESVPVTHPPSPEHHLVEIEDANEEDVEAEANQLSSFQRCLSHVSQACSSGCRRISSFASRKGPLLVFLSGKTVLDVMNIFWTLDQMDALTQLRASISDLTPASCPDRPVEDSYAGMARATKNQANRSTGFDIAVITTSSVSVLADLAALGSAVLHLGDGKDLRESFSERTVACPIIVSSITHVLGAGAAFSSNAPLWLASHWGSKLPPSVLNSLSNAIHKGAGVIIPPVAIGLSDLSISIPYIRRPQAQR